MTTLPFTMVKQKKMSDQSGKNEQELLVSFHPSRSLLQGPLPPQRRQTRAQAWTTWHSQLINESRTEGGREEASVEWEQSQQTLL